MLENIIFLILIIGVPAIFAVFILEGLLIGKLFPVEIILVLAVFSAPTINQKLTILSAAIIGSTIGQTLLWNHFNTSTEPPERLKHVISEERLERVTVLIESYGIKAVFVTNLIPVIRGLSIIPCARTVTLPKFITISLVSTILYHTVSVLVLGLLVDIFI